MDWLLVVCEWLGIWMVTGAVVTLLAMKLLQCGEWLKIPYMFVLSVLFFPLMAYVIWDEKRNGMRIKARH